MSYEIEELELVSMHISWYGLFNALIIVCGKWYKLVFNIISYMSLLISKNGTNH